ncbi:MAG TPA: GDSL-type esterase/lipase family protein [Xanthobacteraceae bacterium]|nr:GDSL-type esterase/lipase family protein [Xanthobacteraceae bacterium]
MPISFRISALVAIAILIPLLVWKPARGYADGPPTYECRDNAKLARLSAPLARMQRLLAAGRPVTIMALGSSSTAGAGASAPSASYPSRLETELRARFPGLTITVTNRGVNGEEVGDMLARFGQAVADDKPDVVLWQVGTNAVLRNNPLGQIDQRLQDGLARMKMLGTDVVLIDPQFAPKVIVKPDAEGMVKVIAAEATTRGVDLFPRFAVMRDWHEVQAIPFEAFLSPDLLHMNDWGYACLAKLLGSAMAEAATRPVAAAVMIKSK